MAEKDIHIRILRCVHKHPDGITIPQIESELNLQSGNLKWVNEECDTGGKKFWRKEKHSSEGWVIQLSMEGRAILLEHDELSHARKSSKQATWIAIGALTVSIIVGIVQINSDTNLNKNQFEKLVDKEQNLDEVNNSLISIKSEIARKDSIILEIKSEIIELKEITKNKKLPPTKPKKH